MRSPCAGTVPVGSYNTTDTEYQIYTASKRNIGITDAVRARARQIVGNETNPYLQARKIYRWMLHTYQSMGYLILKTEFIRLQLIFLMLHYIKPIREESARETYKILRFC